MPFSPKTYIKNSSKLATDKPKAQLAQSANTTALPKPALPKTAKTKTDMKQTTAQVKQSKQSTQSNPAYIPRQFQNLNLYQWQQFVLDSRFKFNDRIVDCIVDTNGCNGKSTVAAYASLNKYGVDLPTQNEGLKLIQSACNILTAKKLRHPGLIFFDMPRAQSKKELAGLYTAIEELKKGRVYDFRHSYSEWWFDSPRIWVFTNKMPETQLLSHDRWRFWKIHERELLSYDAHIKTKKY